MKKTAHFQFFLANDHLYYFHFLNPEGQRLFFSTGFLVKLHAEQAIEAMRAGVYTTNLLEDEGGRFQFEICWKTGLLAKRSIGKSAFFDSAEERNQALDFLQNNALLAPIFHVSPAAIPAAPQPQLPMARPPKDIVGQDEQPKRLKILPVTPPEEYSLHEEAELFLNQKVEPHIASRILRFLNNVIEASEITSTVRDNPNVGNAQGHGIGETVAQRIIDRRESLEPFRRFNSLSQLEGIQGLGPDKFQDLVHAFSTTAAEDFKTRMYDGIIYENWTLEYHTTRFRTAAEFERIALNDSNLIDFIADEVQRISEARFGNAQAAYLADLLLKKSYPERLETGEFAGIAFAFWFYKFDSDNWFSFDRIRAATAQYFGYYPTLSNRLELVLFKGFPNGGILVQGITADDLPVVLNFAEKAITIWTAELFD